MIPSRVVGKLPSKIKIAMVIAVVGPILFGAFSYGVLVGRYRYTPYDQLAPVFQQFYDARQFFVSKSPLNSKDSIISGEASLRANEERLRLISSVSNSVSDTILAAYKPYKITLDSPSGYIIGSSVKSGDSVPVYVNNGEETSVDVYRLGREKTFVERISTLSPNLQSPIFSTLKGLSRNPAFDLNTDGYRSGYYIIELTSLESANRYQLPFVVTPKETPRIALVAQTNTWQAYNSYGGLAYYRDVRADLWTDEGIREYNLALKATLPKVIHLPYARPYGHSAGNPGVTPATEEFPPPVNINDDTRPEDPYDDHLFRSEWSLAAFLEENQLDYGVYTDLDLKQGGPIMQSDVLVFNSHNEYWSEDMLSALREYESKGGKVIFAGGNTIFRGVKHTQYGMRVVKDQIPSYQSSPSLGTSYTGDGFRTYASYKVLIPDHWVFDATGLNPGDEFGAYSANQPRAGTLGYGEAGASGLETDKVNNYSDLYSKSFQTLAIGKNRTGPAYMVFKETDSGGWVFNASSVAFTGALFHDGVIDQLMLNMLTAK